MEKNLKYFLIEIVFWVIIVGQILENQVYQNP